MLKKCENCSNNFEAKRATAKYCSAKCRVNANRGLSVTDSVTSELSVTESEPIVVTLKGDKLDAEIPDFDTNLPDYVPFPIFQRYERPEESGYRAVIDRLIKHTLDELRSMGIWIPNWRLQAE